MKQSFAPDGEKCARLSEVLALVRPMYRKYWLRLLAGFFALVGVGLLQLTIPRILKKGVDDLSAGLASPPFLLRLAVLICLIGIAATVLRFCWRYLIVGFSRYLERDLRKGIFNHIMSMDGPFFGRYTTGSLMAHCTNDLSAVQLACGLGTVAAIDSLVMSVAALFFMFHIHVGLTFLALLPMPILVVTTLILSRRLRHRINRVQEQFSLITEFTRSSITSIRLLKAYTLENSQAKRFDALGLQYVKAGIQVGMIQGLLFPTATLVGSMGMLSVLYYGGQLVMDRAISMGDFVAFVTYLYMLIWPIMAIGWVTSLSQRGVTSMRRIHTLLKHGSHLPEGVAGQRPDRPEFRFHDLTFSYPGSEKTVLESITLEITPGILGITGPTGCGKTTLCQLLARMYPVTDQTLFAGTRDVNDLPPASVREMISYVGQEPFLFSNSLEANISFGCPGAGPAEIEQAAKAAAIHDEIMAIPEGYGALIGERGVTLSGGQRQRVALARALLCDRPVLIIDDGLAAVDTKTELEIMTAIVPLLQKKTVVWVSQRVKQLARADRIVVLEQGKITDSGAYHDVIQRNLFLQQISRRQRLEETTMGPGNA